MATLRSISFCLVVLFLLSWSLVSLGQLPCTFETNICNYTNDGNIDWTRNNGPTPTTNTGPDVDHTHGTSVGYYMYAEASSPSRPGDKARLISPWVVATTQKCVEFYYFMYGGQIGSLNVYVRDTRATTDGDPVWQQSGNRGRSWYRGLATIKRQSTNVEMIFEAVIGSGDRGDIAIDDIGILYSNQECPVDKVECTFETGWCGFTQDRTDNFDFTRRKGSTSSVNTGPSIDHTLGTDQGYYVYIETSGPVTGAKARIMSPLFRGIQGDDREKFCVVFYYHMYGATIGQLNVYQRNITTPKDLGSPVWSISGARGEIWRGAEAELFTTQDFNVVFEAIRGTSYTGDIAIDDVLITSYGCPGHHIIKNESSVSCDFEEVEICYYTQDDKDEFDWKWANRGTSDSFTGPDFDHTRGDELGFFMYASSASNLGPNDKARLISPSFRAQSPKSCIEFWYHMWGRDVATLKVYVVKTNGGFTNPKWTINGDQGNFWHRQTIDVTATSGDYRVAFEAFPGRTSRDDIALDDVMLYSGQDCPTFTTIAPTTQPMPTPLNNLNCDFEADYCGFTQFLNDYGDWSRVKGTGVYNPYATGPKNDHTTGTALGYYLSFDPYAYLGLLYGDFSIIISPVISAKSQDRCLIFWACMYGSYVDYLNVYIREWGSTHTYDPQYFVYGNQGQIWIQQNMTIPASNKPFQIIFEGIVGRSRYYSEKAIDDVTLFNGPCPPPPKSPSLPWSAECNFEDEKVCGYSNYVSSTYYDWVRYSGNTATGGTGPSTDHTLGTAEGHYMYVETSLPMRPGGTAILLSPVINSGNVDLCVRFYYHAYGQHVGSLTASVDYYSVSGIELLYTVTGDQGDIWHPANLQIPAYITGINDFQLRFEARKIDPGFEGDIAIDDIVFMNRPCEGFPTVSQCTFEQGPNYCSIRNSGDADMYWLWYDFLASENSPLPDTDSSSFMYVTSEAGVPGQTAILATPSHDLLRLVHCLTTEIVLTGDSTQQLLIEAEGYDTKTRYPIGTLIGNLGSTWMRGNWSLPAYWVDEPVKFVYTYISGSTSNGIVAIDNVILSTQTDSCADYIHPPSQKPPGNSTGSNPVTGQPQTGSNTALIVGLTVPIVLIVVVAVSVLVFLLCRSNPRLTDKMSSFSIGFKNENYKNDEVPFSGVIPGQGGTVVMTDSKNVDENQSES